MPIRPMTPNDRDSILAIDPKIFPEEEPWGIADFDYYFSSDLCLVSYDEKTNEINGYVFAKRQGEKIHISNIGVLQQSKGLGSQLMDQVIKTAQDLHQSAQFVTLQVRKTNDKAINFYKKYDFDVTSDPASEGFQAMRRPLSLALKQTTKFVSTHTAPLQQGIILRQTAPMFFSSENKLPQSTATEQTPKFVPTYTNIENASKTVRKDIDAVQQEITRLRNNALSRFSIGNTAKADAIAIALNSALKTGCNDVRQDDAVRTALAKHRIFSFFGTKTATALVNVERSYSPNL
ncbi:GNAT family N-acetyltransferase [Legionella brunensis]|uniref:GCN5-related N-acetyltransferase n=1 Tax=Legionella brunensis TaxID=29422 RepID=A0A0W0S4D7_9GAMM|nr:N-acetyltransferase [Legionella brunensis]KTC78194.1 GCN5-related N-acetyltransferase [Legionella brunensis]